MEKLREGGGGGGGGGGERETERDRERERQRETETEREKERERERERKRKRSGERWKKRRERRLVKRAYVYYFHVIFPAFLFFVFQHDELQFYDSDLYRKPTGSEFVIQAIICRKHALWSTFVYIVHTKVNIHRV